MSLAAIRRACLEKHIKAKHTVETPQAELDGGEGYVLQGPFFQRADFEIPEDLHALMDDAEDQELLELAAEAETSSNCYKCRESTAKEKQYVLKVKALQKSQRLLQKINKDKAVELEH